MKKCMQKGFFSALAVVCMLMFGMTAHAQGEDTIKNGIYVGDVNISGMTVEDAKAAVESYVESMGQVELTLIAAKDNEVVVKVSDLGISWANPQVVDEAVVIGTAGNVIDRYKVMKDLEHDNLIYELELAYDMQAISDVLTNRCAVYDEPRIDSSMVRKGGKFEITEGRTGYALDVETSIDKIYHFLMEEWVAQPATLALDIVVDEYRGTLEELQMVQDVLGTFTTSYRSSGTYRSANVQNGTELINGVLLYPGDEFSALAEVTPFTEANGYFPAGSYLNGQVVDSLGGGICQVTTTLYNAVLLAELEISQRYNHSMTVSYVPLAMDAAIAESAGKDFKFVNNTEYPIYIEGFVKNKNVTFNIYGKETRVGDRVITFETEVKETIPVVDVITADPGHPFGYVSSSGGYTGYKSALWKIVTENGEEVSRTQINTSNYKMTQRNATVGVGTQDERIYNEMIMAINTGSLDRVKEVIGILSAQPQYEYQQDDEE